MCGNCCGPAWPKEKDREKVQTRTAEQEKAEQKQPVTTR